MKLIEEKHYINSVYYMIEQTAKYCKSLGVQLFQKHNMPITIDEFTALDTIMLYGQICQRDLAKLILKDRPATGRLLNMLEEKGYIKRFVDTKNNRLVRKMTLTKSGEKILKYATDIIRKYVNNVHDFISEEDIENLRHCIQMFRKGLEKEVEMNI